MNTRLFDPLGDAGTRMHIFLGGYGSGKTELALNTALALNAAGRAVCLVDVDIVNPYFRSGDKSRMLEAKGIRVIAPVFAMTSVDSPILPPTIKSVFDRQDERVVFDVGGDSSGASAIGGFAARIREDRAKVWYVINTCRPMSATVEDNIARLERICGRARLRPDGIIHNANLAADTTPSVVIESFPVIEEVSRLSGIPIAAITGETRILCELPEGMRGLFHVMERQTAYQFQ